jgi:hypothetical protein
MSVDEYFDELISQVHEDYAALNDVTGTRHWHQPLYFRH